DPDVDELRPARSLRWHRAAIGAALVVVLTAGVIALRPSSEIAAPAVSDRSVAAASPQIAIAPAQTHGQARERGRAREQVQAPIDPPIDSPVVAPRAVVTSPRESSPTAPPPRRAIAKPAPRAPVAKPAPPIKAAPPIVDDEPLE